MVEQSIIHHVPVYPGDISTAFPEALYGNLKFRIAHISMSHFFPKLLEKAISSMFSQYSHAIITQIKVKSGEELT
jgi:hypothetical protein